MIYHFKILLEIISLFVGAIIIFNFYQQYKISKDSFIKAVIFYLIFFNMIHFGEVIIRYMKLNIFDIHDNLYAVHWRINRILVMGGVTYTFYNVIYKLQNKELNLSFHIIFFSSAAVVAVTHIWEVFYYYYTDEVIHICNVEGLYVIPIIFIIYAFVVLLIGVSKNDKLKNKQTIKKFAAFMLPAYGLYLIFILLHKINYLVIPIITTYLNIALYLWFNKYYKDDIGLNGFINNAQLLMTLQQKFALTNREKEVLALVIEGKSNKQIEDLLFISPSTVRNHISVAYKKIGINSRGQLMNLILTLRDKN